MFEYQASAQVAPADDQAVTVEVVGTRSGQALKIDRRTYRVLQNPHSAQKDVLQLLRGLPAVTVTPDDQLQLLGAANVTVFVDGRPTRIDLKTLHGTDIERIEIITNPSAQYSAEGTGGIINLVLRRNTQDGVSGNATLEVSSRGRAMADATVKIAHGKWGFEIEPSVASGTYSRLRYTRLRSVQPVPGGPVIIDREEGGGASRSSGIDLRAKATYALSKRSNVAAQFYGGTYRRHSPQDNRAVALTTGFDSYDEQRQSDGFANFLALQLTYDHKGQRDGETLSASIDTFGNPRTNDVIRSTLDDGRGYRTSNQTGSLYNSSKVDWAHPIGERQILSLGASLDFQKNHYRYAFSGNVDGPLGTASDEFRARQATLAAYVTFQQKLGQWAVMPGLRVERNDRRLTSPGAPAFDRIRTDLFPTLHVDRPLGKYLTLTLSYARRIDRAQLQQLRPYPVVTQPLEVFIGNPALRDQSTGARELNLHYRRGKLDAGLIVYDRRTRDLVNYTHIVNAAGQNVSSVINAGRSRDRGAEVDVSTPVVKRVKLTASVNLFASDVPFGVAGELRDKRLRASADGTLEWDGPDRGGRTGDIVQLQFHFESPARAYQLRRDPYSLASLSFTHSFSKTLSLTATASSGVRFQGEELLAPTIVSVYRERPQPELRLKLQRSFGRRK